MWLSLFGLVCLVLGVALVYGSSREWTARRAIYRKPVSTIARVLRLESAADETNSDGNTVHEWYVPIVTYRDQQGMEHTAQLPASCIAGQYAVGKKVHVLYQQDRPERVVERDRRVTGTLSMLVGVVFGLGLLALGCILVGGSLQLKQ